MRTLIGILVALVGSIAGLLLLWYGGGNIVMQLGRFGTEGAGIFPAFAVAGCLLLAAAAASVRWSRAGVIVVGAGHVVFSLVAVLVPYLPFEGVASPAIQLLNELMGVDQGLAVGAVYFISFGGGLLVGAAMLAVGFLARGSRPSVLWRVLSAVGGVLALGPALWAVAAGGDFYRSTFQIMQWNPVVSTVLVVAALLFGVLLAPSGRSATGAWITGGVLALVGVILLVIDPVAFAGLPTAITTTLPVVGWSGTLLAVGASALGLALGITLRPASSPEPQPAAPWISPQETAPDSV